MRFRTSGVISAFSSLPRSFSHSFLALLRLDSSSDSAALMHAARAARGGAQRPCRHWWLAARRRHGGAAYPWVASCEVPIDEIRASGLQFVAPRRGVNGDNLGCEKIVELSCKTLAKPVGRLR